MIDLNKIKACIFDLDGTLVDSMWMWHAIDEEYMQKFSIPLPEDLQWCISGMSLDETAVYFKNRFRISDSLSKIKSDWEEMSVEKYRNEVGLKPGAGEFLAECQRREIRMGIATSNGKKMADAVIDSLQIRNYFDVILTSHEFPKGKSSPDIYLKVSSELGISPQDCLVFEDIPTGILAGKNAGMTVCAVEDDFSEGCRKEKEALSDYMIKDYGELIR